MQVIAIVVLLLSFKRDLSLDFHSARHPLPYDFRAIYCGEYVTVHHGDAYLAQPLRACEVSLRDTSRIDKHSDLFQKTLPLPTKALPATFPPFALTFFSPLGYLSEIWAQRLFYTLSFAALLITIWAASKIVKLPLSMLTIIFAMGMYTQSSVVGAVASLCTLGLVLAALFYQRKQYIACAGTLLLTMLEPQTGLVLFAALFLKEKQMRLPLICAGIALLALSVPFHGIEKTLEYPRMLAIHSRAEEYEVYQLSLTYLAHSLGATERFAASLGTYAYCMYAIVGILLAQRQKNNDALVLALPAAISVLPGSFVHSVYLANMFLAALIFLERYDSVLALAGLAFVSTNWQPLMKLSYDLYLFGSVSGIAAIGAYIFHRGKQRLIVPIGLGLIFGYCGLFIKPAQLEHMVPISKTPAYFASEEWYQFLSAQDPPNASVMFNKMPYFMSMACIMLAARRRRQGHNKLEVIAGDGYLNKTSSIDQLPISGHSIKS